MASKISSVCKSPHSCRVNCGVGLGFEIAVKYFFMEMQELTWVENSLEKLDEVHVKVKKLVN